MLDQFIGYILLYRIDTNGAAIAFVYKHYDNKYFLFTTNTTTNATIAFNSYQITKLHIIKCYETLDQHTN